MKDLNEESIWTHFMDMHSGGGCKESPYEHIYIEAPEPEAITIFYNRFGHNPRRVTCTCCGPDYSIQEGTLSQVSAYQRGCDYSEDEHQWIEKPRKKYSFNKYQNLDTYVKEENVLIIPSHEISSDERRGEVPQQGYVWMS